MFDTYYKRYDEWYEKPFGKSAYKLELDCIKKILNSFNLGLEVGVGTGRFASGINIKYGIDISFNMLKLAKERYIKVVKAKAENLPFKNNSFDLVLIVVSICFIKYPFLALKEAYRVLRNGGRVVLGLILSDSPWADYYKRKREHPIYKIATFYSYYEVVSMLELSGFRILRVLSTLFEKPQEEKPIENLEIREGYYKEAGFTCIEALKL
ncbi:MAG: methyltransferase domain-containing protein [candidate division WOR-3 bacterium]|nr:methyltransferase domain-containing protein [candidate division WOR-3 bacterium]MCX7948109.1 methyltransferase domain-containing protein [candidate division WOR-3 bacterium]MDW8150813.1 class I SAM-dependent methyltransferase [candidate division WOR-3 bacterium]